jgi:hypothetical protein
MQPSTTLRIQRPESNEPEHQPFVQRQPSSSVAFPGNAAKERAYNDLLKDIFKD